jgi:hypothetical protein
MTMIKEFGGIATVIIGNARKALTIVLSFVLFPKPGSVFYLLGGALVFGGLTLNAVSKERGWGKDRPSSSSSSHSYTELPTQPPSSGQRDLDPREEDKESGHQRT